MQLPWRQGDLPADLGKLCAKTEVISIHECLRL